MMRLRFQDHLVIALSAIVFLLALSWRVLPPAPAGFGWDETWYLWMAVWYSGQEAFLGTAYAMLASRQYPPLFPYVLSMTGDVLADFSNGLLLNAALLSAGAGVLMAWLRRLGMHPALLPLAGFLLLFNPVALGYMALLMSEPLFIVLTVCVLMLADDAEAPAWRWALAGLLTGLAVATRSAGWSLVVSLVPVLFLNFRTPRFLATSGGLALGLAFMAFLGAGLPEATGYVTDLEESLRQYGWDSLWRQTLAVTAGWVGLWGSGPGAFAAGLFLLPGWVTRLVRNKADAWYMAISVAMLMVWPFPGQMDRFLWVLLPAAMVSMHATGRLLRMERLRLAVTGSMLLSLAALAFPEGAGRTFERLLDPPGGDLKLLSRLPDWAQAPSRQGGLMHLRTSQALLDDVRRIGELTKPGDCIYSEYPALVSIQARRISFASPWNDPIKITRHPLRCKYYYFVPGALPGASADSADWLAGEHVELFRSRAPWDPSSQSMLGALYQLEVAPAE